MKSKFKIGEVVQSRRKNIFTILDFRTVINSQRKWCYYKIKNMRSNCIYAIDMKKAHKRFIKMGEAAKMLYGMQL
jgi:hypothetical protein